MESLNDSGYSSPQSKCPNGEEKLELHVLRGLNREKVIANANDFLATILKQKYPKMNVAKTLIWAEIRGHHGKKCVNPYTLQCGLIQPDEDIETHEVNKIVCQYVEKLQNTKPYSKLLGSPFFISIRDRKRKAKITKISYKDLRHDDICVVANEEQSFYQALEEDSRFREVDHFTLQEKSKGESVDITYRPCDFKTEYVFEVNVKKKTQTNSTFATTTLTSIHSDHSPVVTVTEEQPDSTPIIPKKIRNWNTLAEKLVEKQVVYDFSKEIRELTAQETRNEMDNCLRARAWSSLVGPEDRRGSKYKKGIAKIARIQYANNHIKARPTLFSKALYPCYDSVGYLECGEVQATCFLISSCIIATCWHVTNDIKKARRASTHMNHNNVFIYFEYEKHGEKASGPRYKLKPLSYEQNVTSESFDYAFLHLQTDLTWKKPLGRHVRCKVPDLGNTCIVAHPNGLEKQEELCPILPLHESRRSLELERRIAEREQMCVNNPVECTLTPSGRECIHLYNSNVQELYGNNSVMTYDVGSMFNGSSGAPVFDMAGNIVALHSYGFRLEETSVVEVGMTFQAIVNDLRVRNLHDFVRENFPHCSDEDMDEDTLKGPIVNSNESDTEEEMVE